MAPRSAVKVPEGTQTGKQFRLKGKGMPVMRTTNVGDLYIQVAVETPQNLTKRQRELLEEFASNFIRPEQSRIDRVLFQNAQFPRRAGRLGLAGGQGAKT